MHPRQASPHTIARSRTTFGLLLQCAQQRLHKAPAQLSLAALDAPLLSAFREHLAQARGNRARSRNACLAALHAFCHSAALYAPQDSALIHRVRAIPSTRTEQTDIAVLTRPEIAALLEAPSPTTGTGRRDRTL
jgi:integrase/recombinase XerD